MFFPINLFGAKIRVVFLWFLVAGIFFTLYFRGICFWGVKHSIECLKKPKKNGTGGEISPLGALMTALSGTVGLGTIAGVAISISIGGRGAAFWILFGGVIGMAVKFSEVTLSLKY